MKVEMIVSVGRGRNAKPLSRLSRVNIISKKASSSSGVVGSEGRFKFIPEIPLTERLVYFLLFGITESGPMPILLDVRILGTSGQLHCGGYGLVSVAVHAASKHVGCRCFGGLLLEH
ncbi:MAG: hypothetical protein QNL92_02400 [Octadecabacter sp.]